MNRPPPLPVRRRVLSLACAALLTVAVLAGIDQLASVEGTAPQLAQQPTGARA